MKRVVVVGTGASGTLVAANLLRLSGAHKVQVTLVGDERPGSGPAYTTTFPRHLLNVPAGGMSALADDPEHFLRWIGERDASVDAGTFVPRMLYGQYLRETLDSVTDNSRFRFVAGRVTSITDGAIVVEGDRPVTIPADVIVLATGHSRHRPIWRRLIDEHSALAANPFGALPTAKHEDSRAVVIGAGLTGVDLALRLKDSGFREISLLSRSGGLPKAHNPRHRQDGAAFPAEYIDSPDIDAIEGWIRAGDWRSRVDAIRPHTATVWRALGDEQQTRFLREKQRPWNVLRHRMAPQIAAEISEMRESGVLRLPRGSVTGIDPTGETVTLHADGVDGAFTLENIELVVDATGTGKDIAQAAELDPLWAGLLGSGAVQLDRHGLGVRTDDDGKVLSATNTSFPIPLYTLAALRTGELWESTAMPEIRAQSYELAQTILKN